MASFGGLGIIKEITSQYEPNKGIYVFKVTVAGGGKFEVAFTQEIMADVPDFKQIVGYSIVKYIANELDNEIQLMLQSAKPNVAVKSFTVPDNKIIDMGWANQKPSQTEGTKTFVSNVWGSNAKEPTVLAELKKAVPALDQPSQCPIVKECISRHGTLASIIIHLNDDHKWSRERVADWLETLDVDLKFEVKE
jgi:hypothetical protein